jgi:glycerol uptake facilitator-like aquaporin
VSLGLAAAGIALGIATANPIAIVGGVFDLILFAAGHFPPNITLAQLSDKLKKIDKNLNRLDKRLDDLNEAAKNMDLTISANTIINQITPAMSGVGMLWQETQQ